MPDARRPHTLACVRRAPTGGFMPEPMTSLQSRRALLRFLAASPLAYGVALGLRVSDSLAQAEGLIEDAAHAVNVFDFEAYVKRHMPIGHYTYLAYGADDSAML